MKKRPKKKTQKASTLRLKTGFKKPNPPKNSETKKTVWFPKKSTRGPHPPWEHLECVAFFLLFKQNPTKNHPKRWGGFNPLFCPPKNPFLPTITVGCTLKGPPFCAKPNVFCTGPVKNKTFFFFNLDWAGGPWACVVFLGDPPPPF